MKTYRLKNYLKLAILFFGIVFLFYKCEIEHFEHQQNNNGFTVKTIHSKEIAENRLLSKTLEKIQKSKTDNVSFRTVYNNQHDFYIDTEEAIYIENGNYHSYTFPIYRGFQTDLTENLLLSLQADLTYKVFIVSYDFTEAEKQLVETGQYVSLTDKAIFTPLENFDTGEITNDLSRTYYNAELDYCYELVEETSKSTGWTILVEKQVPCQTESLADNDTGSGSGSSGTGGSTDTGNDDPTDGDPYDGSLGGGSTDGDNTYDPNTGNNDGTNPDENTDQLDDCLQTDENGNCIGNATSPIIKTRDYCNSSIEDINSTYSLLSPFNVDLSGVNPCESIDTVNVAENQKFMCVYNKLVSLPSFKNILNDVFENSETFDVKFEIVENLINPKSKPVNGLTIRLTDASYKIQIDKSTIENHSLLFIAKVILHEAIHANLYARASLESNANLENEFINNTEYEYQESFLLNYYANVIFGVPNWQHNFMANELLTDLTILLQDFHNLYPDSDFKAYLGEEYDWTTLYKDLTMAGSLQETNYYKTTYTNNLNIDITNRVNINITDARDLSQSQNICD